LSRASGAFDLMKVSARWRSRRAFHGCREARSVRSNHRRLWNIPGRLGRGEQRWAASLV